MPIIHVFLIHSAELEEMLELCDQISHLFKFILKTVPGTAVTEGGRLSQFASSHFPNINHSPAAFSPVKENIQATPISGQ